MISVEKLDLTPKEDRALRDWLGSASAVIFLDALRAEAADESVQLANILERDAINIACGGSIPNAALPKIRTSATLNALISLLERKIAQKEPFYRANITIS